MLKSRTIILCGQKWRVQVVKEIEGCTGQTFHASRMLKIAEQGNGDIAEAVLHECFHAVIRRHQCDYDCANGNGVPENIVVMNHGQLTNIVRDVFGAFNQIYEMRVRK